MDFSSLCSVITLLLFLVFRPIEGASSRSDGSALALIRNNVDLYFVLIDRKNFQALDKVFTPDASPVGLAGPDSGFPNNLTGIELFLKTALDDTTTLHYSDTQYVELSPAGDTATSVTYVQAVYFAKDVNVTGQIYTYYEQYFDDFILIGDQWLSQNKSIQVTVGFYFATPLLCCRKLLPTRG